MRFILMGGIRFYPLGGFEDFQSAHETLADAQAAADPHLTAEEWSDNWWAWANIGGLLDNKLYFWRRESIDAEWKIFKPEPLP